MRRARTNGMRHAIALAGLLGVLAGLPGLDPSGSTGGSGSPDWHAMGHLSSAGGTLRAGCHQHSYRYAVSPPSSQWSLETFLTDPAGKRLASDVIISGADKRSGSKAFTICRSNTRPGRFTIKAKLTYEDYPSEPSGWIRPAHFRLTRP